MHTLHAVSIDSEKHIMQIRQLFGLANSQMLAEYTIFTICGMLTQVEGPRNDKHILI